MKYFIFPKVSLFLFIIKCKYNIYVVPKLDTSSDFNTNLTQYLQTALTTGVFLEISFDKYLFVFQSVNMFK